jgi:uncharacterized protein
MAVLPDRTEPPPWGLVTTPAWVVLAFAAGAFAAVLYHALPGKQPGVDLSGFDGVLLTVGLIISVPVEVAVLAAAARFRRWPVLAYLAINIPRRGELIMAVACVIAVTIVFDVLLYATGQDIVTPFQIDAYRTAKEAGWLPGMLVAFVIIAPIGEEIAFRGFLYRGWAREGREIHAIALIALIWAVMHIQYDWIGIAQIFALGLLLGWFRWASGSTTLPILMHILINFESMVETAIKVEYFS